MAFFDSTLQFSNAQAITATADSTVLDVVGAGVGTSPAMIGAGGINTALGYDIGTGDGVARPEVQLTVTTAGVGVGTVAITLKAAPDNGSYSAGTFTDLYTSRAFTFSALTAGTVITFPVPEIVPGEALPRFYKLTYTVTGATGVSFTANLLLNPPSLRVSTLYGNNFIAL